MVPVAHSSNVTHWCRIIHHKQITVFKQVKKQAPHVQSLPHVPHSPEPHAQGTAGSHGMVGIVSKLAVP